MKILRLPAQLAKFYVIVRERIPNWIDFYEITFQIIPECTNLPIGVAGSKTRDRVRPSPAPRAEAVSEAEIVEPKETIAPERNEADAVTQGRK